MRLLSFTIDLLPTRLTATQRGARLPAECSAVLFSPIIAIILALIFGLLCIPKADTGALVEQTPNENQKTAPAPSDANRWFPTASQQVRGAVVVVHGLNNKPEIMNSIVNQLNQSEFDVCRVSLDVYAPGQNAADGTLAERWSANIETALVSCRHNCPGKPISMVAYSLGGLVVVRYLDTNPAAVNKLILLAPAIRLTGNSQLFRPLAKSAKETEFSIPSFAPKKYRARDGTPFAEYNAMYELVDSVNQLKNPDKLAKIKTLILLNRQDELVSYSGLVEWIGHNRLDTWQIKPLEVSESATYKHLIIVPESLGAANWNSLIGDIIGHLSK